MFRLEWRSPADTDMPGFGLCALFDDAASLKCAALQLARDGEAIANEFYVVELLDDTSVVHRVLTDACAIRAWQPASGIPPEGAGTVSSWAADIERADAAMAAMQAVRTSVERAYRAGSLSAEAASRLLDEARRALDDE